MGLEMKDLVTGVKPDDLSLIECSEDWSHTGTPQWACKEATEEARKAAEGLDAEDCALIGETEVRRRLVSILRPLRGSGAPARLTIRYSRVAALTERQPGCRMAASLFLHRTRSGLRATTSMSTRASTARMR